MMNDLERQSLRNAVTDVTEKVRADFLRMHGVSKSVKKAQHKARMQAFQNNAFNKGKRNGK